MTHPNPPRRHWSSRVHKGFQHACAGHLETLAAEPRCPTECAAQSYRLQRLSRPYSDHSKQEFLKMSSYIASLRRGGRESTDRPVLSTGAFGRILGSVLGRLLKNSLGVLRPFAGLRVDYTQSLH